MKTFLSLTLALVLTVLALVYSLWDVDLGQLNERLHNGNYGLLPLFLAVLALFYWLKSMRWTVLLRPLGQFSTRQVFPSVLIGFAGNNLLPAHLGEVIRMVVFARGFKQPIGGVFVSLVLEKLLDATAILTWYFVALLFVAQVPDALGGSAVVLTVLIGAVAGGILCFLLFPSVATWIWRKINAFLPHKLATSLESLLGSTVQVLSGLKSSHQLFKLFANSLAQWGLMLVMIWISLWTYDITVSPPVIALLLAVLTLAVALPNSPGYVGAMQAAYVFTLSPFGVGEESAFAASLLYLFAQWVPVTLLGIAFFATSGLDIASVWSDLRKAMRSKQEPAQSAE
jgi:uncharacterized protein (TIRG00374 family)